MTAALISRINPDLPSALPLPLGPVAAPGQLIAPYFLLDLRRLAEADATAISIRWLEAVPRSGDGGRWVESLNWESRRQALVQWVTARLDAPDEEADRRWPQLVRALDEDRLSNRGRFRD